MCSRKLIYLYISFQYLTYCAAESYYLVTDKPVKTFADESVFPYMNVTATRYDRQSLTYYTTVHVITAVPLDDNYTMEIVFYENVNNQFRRSFIEMQFKWCSFLFKDPLFGAAVRKQLKLDQCPTPAGEFHVYNMTSSADHLPRLPFSKGRIYMHFRTKSKTVFKGYFDMEVKRMKPPKPH